MSKTGIRKNGTDGVWASLPVATCCMGGLSRYDILGSIVSRFYGVEGTEQVTIVF